MHTILAGEVLPTLKGHIIFKNWHLCRIFYEYYKRKNLHILTPPQE